MASRNLCLSDLNQEILLAFVSHLSTARSIRGHSLSGYMAGVRSGLLKRGLPCHVFTPLVTRAIRAVKLRDLPPKPTQPITLHLLSDLRQCFANESVDELTYWSVCVIAFYGLFRLAELLPDETALRIVPSDVTFHHHPREGRYASMLIRKSKVDPFGKGSKVHLPCIGHPTCPVRACYTLCCIRAKQELFIVAGKPLSRVAFANRLRAALRMLNLPAELYSGHSFRRGGATTASQIGLSETSIKALGRWRSSAYLRYVDNDIESNLRDLRRLVDFGTPGVGMSSQVSKPTWTRVQIGRAHV